MANKITRLLDENGIRYKQATGSEVMMNCPSPSCFDEDNHFYLNTVTVKAHCHKCGYSLGKVGVYKTLLNVSFALRQYSEEESSFKKEEEEPDVMLDEIELPLMCRPIKADHPYMRERRIDAETIKRYKLGFCPAGPMASRLIIPVYMYDKLVSWNARDITGHAKKKYLYPYGKGKGSVIFNFDRAMQHSTVVLCEGALDAMRVGLNGVAIGRKRISAKQVDLLASGDVKTVFVALDGSAIIDAMDVCDKISPFFSTYLCKVPRDKDPDDLRTREVFELLNNALPYTKALRAQVEVEEMIHVG